MCLNIFSLIFADDSNIFRFGKDPKVLIIAMNGEMGKVIDWLRINRLSLNFNKTHVILFQRKKVSVSLSVDVIINNAKIESVEKKQLPWGHKKSKSVIPRPH